MKLPPAPTKFVRHGWLPRVLSALLILGCSVLLQGQDFLWLRHAGGTNDSEVAESVATDSLGNVYVAGTFSGTATFGTNTLAAPGGPGWGEMFLAKYSKAGELLWVRQAGGVWDDGASAIAVDQHDNIYVTGWFETNAVFGSILLSNYNQNPISSDIFLAKYGPDGNVLWARSAGGRDYDYADALALDPNGNPIITGYFRGTGYFGPYSFGGYGSDEMFIAKYDPDGNVLWAGMGSSTGYDRGEGLAVDSAGYIYLGGHFQGTTLNFFNGTVLTNSPGWYYMPYVAKYTPSGAMQWARLSTNISFIFDVAAAGTNGVYIVGNDFGVDRWDADGKELWTTLASGYNTTANAVTTDNQDNLYVIGSFFGTNITFPCLTFTNGASTNIGVLACYDTGGAFRWARQFGGASGRPRDVTVDSAGRLYLAGSFTGTSDFGTNTVSSFGGSDIFVARVGVLAPMFVKPPSDATVFTGESNTFTVSVLGEPPILYQWRYNGSDLPTATNSTLPLTNIQLENAGSYSVRLTNDYGFAESPPGMLTVVTGAPVILVQPQSQVVLGGTSPVLRVVATNSLPFAYQWQHEGTSLTSGTLATLVITEAGAKDRGGYLVIVTNLYGAATSEVATLTVNVPPTILTQPQSQTVLAGTDVTFSVEATGDGVLSYQWRFKGAPLVDATSSALTLMNVGLTNEGAYSVVVSNLFGTATSSSASLVVNTPPSISVPPIGQTLPAGSNVTFSVGASGSPILRYEWQLEGNSLPGATRSTLSLTNVQAAQSGAYRVRVTNTFGAVTSGPARLTVVPSPPVILAQPADLTTNVLATVPAALSVRAVGSEPLHYQWQRDGNNLASGTVSSLGLTNLQLSDAGVYRVIITNAYGAVTSAPALLSVSPGFEWAQRLGGEADDSAAAVVADRHGNTLVAGSFGNTAQFEGSTLVSRGGSDAYVAKYDAAGNLRWVWQGGGAQADTASALAVDAEGNVVVFGLFTGAADFAGTNLTSLGSADLFLIKLDAQGALLWARQLWGSTALQARAAACDATGACIVAGAFTGSVTAGNLTVNSAGGSDVFTAKIDANGNFVWLRVGGGTSSDSPGGIGTDREGNVYVTGSCVGSATFDTIRLTNSSAFEPSMFLIKYDSSGNALWGRRAGRSVVIGSGAAMGNSMAVGEESGVLVTGQFNGVTAFEGSVLSSSGGKTNLFVARYTTGGELVWARPAGNTNRVIGSGIALDPAGNAYITGSFEVNTIFGTFKLTASGSNDCFLATLDGAGRVQWVRKTGGTRADLGRAIASDENGIVVVAGDFQTNLVFDVPPLTLTNAGGFDGFVARLAVYETNGPPTITTPPAHRTSLIGGNLVLSAGFRGGGPLSFQWFQNGAPVPGATNSVLPIANFGYNHAGQYALGITSPYGSTTSAPASIGVEQEPDFAWVVKAGGTGTDEGRALVVDGAGTLCLAGRFGANLTLGTNTLSATAATNLFLARYTPDGSVLWAQKVTGTGAVIPGGLALDARSNLWLVGQFSKAAAFGTQWITNSPLPPSFAGNGFVAQYDSGGNLLWVTQHGTNATGWANCVTADPAGNGYVGGFFASPTAQFGNFVLTNSGQIAGVSNAFLAKYDGFGKVAWATKVGGTGTHQVNGVAVDRDGNVYVTGAFFGVANFGGGYALTNFSSFISMIFVAKYNNAGGILWARQGAEMGIGVGQRVAVDAAGNLYASGYKSDYGTSDLITKFDSNGNVIWFRQTTLSCCTGGYVSGHGLALDALGNPCLCGELNGSVYFDDHYLNGGGYVAKYGSDGTLLWLRPTGGGAYALALGAHNRLYATGRFSGTASFGQHTLVSSGSTDAFIVRLSPWEPSLSLQPAFQTLGMGSNLTLVASGSAGSLPLAYQWLLNGVPIAGATSSRLVVNDLQMTNAGVYSLMVSNTAGSTSSLAGLVNVLPQLSLVRSNDIAFIVYPTGFTLETSAQAGGPYQPIPGAVSPWPAPLLSQSAAFYRLSSNPHSLLQIRSVPSASACDIGLTGTPGQNYVLESSTNLLFWEATSTNVPPCTFPAVLSSPSPQFYRARLLR